MPGVARHLGRCRGMHACTKAPSQVHRPALPLPQCMHAGAGWTWTCRQYGKDYASLEDTAHAARRGIWSGTFQMPSEWRKENKRKESGPVSPAVAFQALPAAILPPAVAAPAAVPGVTPCAGGARPAIKGNISSDGQRIYHLPAGRYYDRVKIEVDKGEKLFCSEAEAQAAGWRASSQ